MFFPLFVTVHTAGGDWSIFRPIGATFISNAGRKHGPAPFFPAV